LDNTQFTEGLDGTVKGGEWDSGDDDDDDDDDDDYEKANNKVMRRHTPGRLFTGRRAVVHACST